MVKDTKHLGNRVFLRGKMKKALVKYLSKDSAKGRPRRGICGEGGVYVLFKHSNMCSGAKPNIFSLIYEDRLTLERVRK